MTPEIQLLLACARSRDAAAEVGVALSREPDWDTVWRLAEPHGMEPGLYLHLAGRDLPDSIHRRIVDTQTANAARNLAATAELLLSLISLRNAGVDAVTYKGPVLSIQLYGDVALRRYVDLDLMVRPDEVSSARAVLLSRGYVADADLPGWQFEAYLRSQKEIAFAREADGRRVDLQWAFTTSFSGLRWDLPAMHTRTVDIQIAETSVRTFSDDDLASILSVHGSAHLWDRLSWVADLGALIDRGGIEWPRVLFEARRIGAETMVVGGGAGLVGHSL